MIKFQVTALLKAQTTALNKQQEAETSYLNKIATVISSFANYQGSQKPPEANGTSPETATLSEAVKLNVIMKKHKSDP